MINHNTIRGVADRDIDINADSGLRLQPFPHAAVAAPAPQIAAAPIGATAPAHASVQAAALDASTAGVTRGGPITPPHTSFAVAIPQAGAVANGMGQQQLSALQQQGLSIAYNALSNGALAHVDASLAANYYAATSSSLQMQAFINENPDLPGAAFLAADGHKYIWIDAVAKNGDGAALLQDLQAVGLTQGASYGAMAGGLIDASRVGGLIGLDNLQSAGEAGKFTHVGNVTTQADGAQYADVARATYGVTGAGVQVGILSDSFNTSTKATSGTDSMATNIASNDLPTATTVYLDQVNGTDEGRGMAQLVHDLAPGASIDFSTAYATQANFASNILQLAARGAKVIVDDISYFAEPMFQDGVIAQAVTQVVNNNGVTYFSSAANSGANGWEGAWNGGALKTIGSGATAKTESFMQFADGQDYLTVNLKYYSYIAVGWDQSSTSAAGAGHGPTGDIDVFLTNQDGSIIYRRAVTNNITTGIADEILAIQSGSPTLQATTYYLRVGLSSGTAPGNIKIVSYDNDISTTASNVNNGTIYGHAAADGAIAVAAAPYDGTPIAGVDPAVLEYFSSVGNVDIRLDTAGNLLTTPIIRDTPQITGVDGGNTTFFGSDDGDADALPNFYGTSAAAPDVAAVAALMLEARAGLTSVDILNLLKDSASDMGAAGYDRESGAGLVNAAKAAGFAKLLVIENAGQQILNGTHFDDTLVVNSGNLSLAGGAGSDTISFTNATSGVTVDLTQQGSAHDFGGGLGAKTLSGFENVTGGDYADALTGDAGANSLDGAAGSDTIEGGGGDDILNGGGGFDTVSYVHAGSGVTVNLVSQASAQTTGVGSQTLYNFENVTGSDYADTLTGDLGNNVLAGGAGGDTLAGGDGHDTLDGGDGVDTASYAGFSQGVSISLAVATEQAAGAGGQVLIGIENLSGSDGADALGGDTGDNAISGADGADTLDGGAGGHDTLDGGAGRDTAVFSSATGGLSLSLAVATEQTTADGAVSLISVENLVGSSYADALAGDLSDNSLAGGAGGDTLAAGAGGADTLDGGADNDTATFANYGSNVSINLLATGAQTLGADSVTLISIENVIGSAFDDVLLGDFGGNLLSGGAGDDVLGGRLGADTLDGGADNDTATFEQAFGPVTVSLQTQGVAQDTGAGLDTLISIENLVGSFYNDRLTGDGGANLIFAGAGADTVDASAGGDDLLFGGAGVDLLDYSAASAGVSVDLRTTAAQSTGIGLQAVAGFEDLNGSAFADRLTGDKDANVINGADGADVLSGDNGDDQLTGGVGLDTLVGGAGADTLTTTGDGDVLNGGLGADHFVFLGLDAVRSAKVLNLAVGDVVDFSAIDTDAVADGDQGFTEVAKFHGVAGEFKLAEGVDRTTMKIDLDGDGKVDHQIVFSHADPSAFDGFVL